ncbi:MAG: 4-alpha-glucanotransferase, partial [Bacteroidetes bacterium]|nr:4-alpha-glucanotransferase [Bacteroidota bacterium]
MKIDFYLRFYTHPGQSILVTGNIPQLGNDDIQSALALDYVNGEFWHGSLVLAAKPEEPLRYHYILRNEDGTLTEEWGEDKLIDLPGGAIGEVQVIDTWNYAGEFENVFYSNPFREVLLPRHKPGKKARSKTLATHRFLLMAPLLTADELVCLLGYGTTFHVWV